MDVNTEAVAKIMSAHQVTTLIHGHTHRPARHSLQLGEVQAERLVLGDWNDQAWWIRVNDEGLTLESSPLVNFS